MISFCMSRKLIEPLAPPVATMTKSDPGNMRHIPCRLRLVTQGWGDGRGAGIEQSQEPIIRVLIVDTGCDEGRIIEVLQISDPVARFGDREC